jgi:hypothetical protein
VVCKDTSVNTEPQILVAYQPAAGQSVGTNGQIKVWVTDENPPFMAPGEVIDPATGTITAPGNRTFLAPDGFPYEPALYISPQTAKNGGTPHFPQAVKGQYCLTPPTRCTMAPANVPIDPVPAGSPGLLAWTDEYIWDVNVLGLAPGTYAAEFWIFDGDKDRGIGCVNIDISVGVE